MVRAKRKHFASATATATASAAKSKDQEGPVSKLDDAVPSDLLGEDNWVVVKKQKINILIPPKPGAHRSTSSIRELTQLPRSPIEGVHCTSQAPNEAAAKDQVQPPFKDMSKSRTHAISRKAGSPPPEVSALTRPRMPLTRNSKSNKQDQCSSGTYIHEPNYGATKAHFKPSPTLGVSRNVKRRRLMTGLSCLNEGKSLLNQMMRRSNLERKLVRAGGLSQWLTSMGLEQFVRIFQVKKVSKFQLVNMSMQKLKDMGTFEVGPRRKLMHAIDCLCQPNCFQAL